MKNKSTLARLGALFPAAAIVVSFSSPALAADYSWQTAGTTNAWSTVAADTNWFVDAGTTLSPWADGNAAIFAEATGEAVTLTGTVAPTTTTINNDGTWSLTGTGVLGGTGTLNKNGTGVLTLSNTVANTFSGGTTLNAGTLSLGTGGTGADTSTVGALGTGAATLSGGTLRLWIQNSKAFTIANNLSVNNATIHNEDGNHTLSGTVAIGAAGATLSSKWSGKNFTLTGVLSGTGAVKVNRSADGGGSADATVILTNSNSFTGGTTVNSGVLQLGNAIATDKGTAGVIRGTLTVNSPGTVILGFTNALGYAAGQKVDTFNINGGTVTHTANGDNGWGVTYNLAGGTLQTTGTGQFSFGNNTSVNTAAFASSATLAGRVVLRENNTGNTVNFTVADGAAPFDLVANAAISQTAAGYGITKLGDGTMVLNGADTYSGATTVNAGTLALGATGTLTASPVVVNANGNFRSDVAGKSLVSLAANGGSRLSLIAAPGATTTVTGALNLEDGGSISVSPILGAVLPNGTYDLITAGSITGTGTPVTALGGAFGPTRVTGTVVRNGNKLQFNATSAGANLVWNNASAAGAAIGTWDLNTLANFNNGGTTDVFQSFDAVTFDDSVAAAAAKTVNVAGTVAPSVVTVNNSTGNNYTLTALTAGAGQLAGVTSIVKAGTGSLILGANLLYTATGGQFSLSGGTLDLGGKTLPAQSKLTLTGGATLANGTLPVFGSFDFQQGTSSAALTGAGTWVKSTANTVILSGNGAITGAGTLSEGTLQVGNAGTTGVLGTGTVSVATGATLAFNRSDTAVPNIANAISGSGAIVFNGTNNGLVNGQSSYGLSGNNSGFSGTILATNARLTLDNANDTGTAALSTGINGQFFVTAGIYPNPITIAGNGWGEAAGLLGAIRLQGGTLSGPITLSGDSRITSHNGSGTLSGVISETGGARNLEFGGTSVVTSLTLTGNSTYTGTTAINNANITLRGSLGNTAVTVGPASTIGGNGSIGGSLTFAAGATNLAVNLSLPGSLAVTGAVNLSGTTTVTLIPNPGLTPGGNITLLTYGSVTGTAANLVLANAANYRQAVFSVGANALTLQLATKALTWTGTGGLTWDVATTQNWLDATPAASAYYQADAVTFTDSAGAANGTVTVTAALTPAMVTVNNSTTVPYNFTGAGSIGGGASLLKQGNGTLSVNVAMPYTGGTTINGGKVILDGNNAQNRQAAGALVAVNNGATLEILGANAAATAANSINPTINAGGTLRYVTGASPATSATIGSHAHVNNLTLNGGTLEFTYSGSGVLYSSESVQFNGTLTVGGTAPSTIQSSEPATNQGLALAGNRPFVVPDVTGNAEADLIVTAEIENSDSNNGALTKTGAGTLLLSAASSYSAGTTVTAGTLALGNGSNGSATGTGALTIAAGTRLIGDGSASGATTIAGTVSPGATAGVTGYLTMGATTLTGNYACDIEEFNCDFLLANGNLTLTGAQLNLTAVGQGFTESSYEIVRWTGTRTGAFATVTGLPAGYSVQYDDANKVIRVGTATGYTEWLADFPGLQDTTPTGDSDKDGIVNLLEYILGGSPLVSSTGILPTQVVTPTSVQFTFKRSDDSEADTVQVVQYSTNLTTWIDVAVNPAPAAGVTIVENGTADDDVTVTIPRNSEQKVFARLKATN